MNNELVIANKEEMKTLARIISSNLQIPSVIGLSGPLGAGKTEFARAFCANLGVPEREITSPTYQIQTIYIVANGREIHHWDLYRLKGISSESMLSELEEGITDPNVITLIEWPEIVPEINSLLSLTLFISFPTTLASSGEPNEEARTVSFAGPQKEQYLKVFNSYNND
jgi:tRNA threonylcarbamoyladenosine biosynthesis protein TsaE